MPDPVTAGIGIGGTVLSTYLSADAAKDAAQTSADASAVAAQMQYDQYQQGRQDLAPYRGVAVGQEIYGNKEAFERDLYAYDSQAENLKVALKIGQMTQPEYQAAVNKLGARPTEETWTAQHGALDEVTGYTGGALNTLADYGRSKVSPGDYIPDTRIPEYQGSTIGDLPAIESRIPEYDPRSRTVTGDIPEFDSTQFDIYKDPSYDWRKGEMLRGIDRTAGATGKITSGNRMEEILQRTGQMASQEYGAARDRMVQDYGIRRENEATQFGRDYRAEADIYGRDVARFGAETARANTLYGRGVDEYGRAYARDVDQYGRDLTGYNALVAREAGEYGRGVDAYGRAYGQEGDYLNRLAALSQIGQTATNTGVGAGTQSAYYGGQAVQAAGNAQAAGTLGVANAYSSGLGDLTSMYTMSRYQPPVNTYNYGGTGGGIPYNSFVSDPNYTPYMG